MRTLIMGQAKGLGETLSNYLVKKRHSVVVVDLFNSEFDDLRLSGSSLFLQNNSAQIQALFSSFDFDNVIFIPPMPDLYCYNPQEQSAASTEWISYFMRILDKSVANSIKKFILCSSLYTIISEKTDNFEGIENIWALKAAEKYFDSHQGRFNTKMVCAKLPNICCTYGTGNFEDMILQGSLNGKIVRYGTPDLRMEFASDIDISRILLRLLIVDVTGEFHVAGEVVNNDFLEVVIGKHINVEQVLINRNLPHMPEASKVFLTNTISYAHTDNIEDCIQQTMLYNTKKKKSRMKKIAEKFWMEPIFALIEIVIGFILILIIPNLLVGGFERFKFIDFKMMYVVIIASIWGMKYGVIASVFAALAYFIERMFSGMTWVEFIISPDAFFPISIYVLVAVFVGYSFDRIRRGERTALYKQKVTEEKYTFLTQAFKQTVALKEGLSQQVANYGDSFGKIYKITRDLDFLQSDRVFIAAIAVLEEAFETDSVGIYFLNKNNLSYARLMANSQTQTGKLASSLKLSTIPDVMGILFANRIHVNKELKKNSPAYGTFVYDGNQPIALILIYQVDFDKLSQYYENLFRVITGLIQTSLSRAYRFYNPSNGLKYFVDTTVLTYNALLEKYEAKVLLKQKTQADFTCLRIDSDNITLDDADKISKTLIRESDELGLGNNGQYYVLLSNTALDEADRVMRRFTERNINVTVVDKI